MRQIFDLTGKIALVTGGAGIIGSQVVRGLAEFGAVVIIADINKDKGESLAQELNIELNANKAYSCFVDVTSEESVQNMVSYVQNKFNSIDILHNNAAGKSNDLDAFFKEFEEYDLEQWKDIMDADLTSMFLVAREVGKVMKQQEIKGSIIQTASIYAVVAPDQRIYEGSYYLDREINTPAVYSTAKSGVIGLTKYLSAYWGKSGIRVNAITPGGIESGQNDTFKHKYSERVPLGRMAKAEEMVGAVVYLASDASSYVTGQNIIVDGGLSVW
ncbi:SDR family oxidoreductase [Salibacterium qingdaonense]|uniref:NAD(P)-dependent dehydrogenase, short-chain alcohol dehydrogenase family n=1 Tax=Salibacterium qingdaonense TaxID=266892 RepID=A0A1I4KZM5_9BACI|nr:SDR family oxidoreductase [Salibacterium qingdaonense]SFL84043.1 NAD(P)-dependent dehydrogenase, short-chain alcohol dehydrogenase family [Salibacterium qingdaonense]